MSYQTWVETIAQQSVAGTSFSNYTTAQSVIPGECLVTLLPSYWKIGRSLEIDVWGGISNIVTTPGTMTFNVKLGSVVAFTTGAIQLNATAHTLLPFHLRAKLTCRAVGTGTSANLMGMAVATGVMFTNTAGQTDGANSNTVKNVPATAPAVGTGFDSTISNLLDLHVAFSIADAGNAIKVEDYCVKSLN